MGGLEIIVVSYRQTIRAYPNGGGSYIVARENLGTMASLRGRGGLAHRLRADGLGQRRRGGRGDHVGFPDRLAEHGWRIAAVFILAIMLVNLRGIRESGTIFALPTYVFLVTTLGLIGFGVGRHDWSATRRRSTGVAPADGAVESLGLLLLMRAFADGCSAITGVEAISNGVPAFRRPSGAMRA